MEELEEGKESSSEHITEVVKENLKLIRHTKGFSLDKLASRCGVSRAMLSQIEQGKSVPTISVLWKIANGLNVPFSELLKEKGTEGVIVMKAETPRFCFLALKFFPAELFFLITEIEKQSFMNSF